MGKMDEQILVAPRKDVFEDEQLTFQGVSTNKDVNRLILENMASTYSVMRRGDAEEDENYKQPIPYAALTRGNELFVYKRLGGGGETRLHDSLSIGVGGHCNQTNHDTFEATLKENLDRELEEELFIESDIMHHSTIGLINDDENDVGRVHIGLLTLIELDIDSTVTVRETDQLEGQWMTLDELSKQENYNRLEAWSQYIVDYLNNPLT